MKSIKFLKRDFLSCLLNFATIALLMISQTSCFKQYYQTNTTKAANSDFLKSLQTENKYFIIQTPVNAFALVNVKVSGDSISGEQGFLDLKNGKYLNPKGEYKNSVSRAGKEYCIKQVHIYTDNTFSKNAQVHLAINQISHMDVYGLDKNAISESRVTSIVGIAVGVGAIIGLGAAYKSSSYGGYTINLH